MKNNIKFAYLTLQLHKKSVIIDNKNKEDNNNFLELAMYNNYLQLNQSVSLFMVIKEILSILDITFRDNIILLVKVSQNLNAYLLDLYMTEKFKNLYQSYLYSKIIQ